MSLSISKSVLSINERDVLCSLHVVLHPTLSILCFDFIKITFLNENFELLIFCEIKSMRVFIGRLHKNILVWARGRNVLSGSRRIGLAKVLQVLENGWSRLARGRGRIWSYALAGIVWVTWILSGEVEEE